MPYVELPDRPRGLVRRFAWWYSRRRFTAAVDPVRAAARHSGVLLAMGAFEMVAWAFNPVTRDTDPPPEVAAALNWAERASLPVAELEDTATLRLALAACAAISPASRPRLQ